MRRLIPLALILVAVMFTGCGRSNDEVSLIDTPAQQPAVSSNMSDLNTDNNERSDITSESNQEESINVEPSSTYLMDYDDTMYDENIITSYRVNEKLYNVGYNTVSHDPKNQTHWIGKTGRNNKIEVYYETEAYITRYFKYILEIPDLSDESIKNGVNEMLDFLNIIYPDAFDSIGKESVVRFYKQKGRTGTGATFITEYKPNDDVWFKFLMNPEKKTIVVVNSKYD